MARETENLPQIVAIADLKREGGLYLCKSVRESLSVPKDGVVRCLVRDGEIWLTAQAHEGAPLALESRGRVTLPDDILTALRVADGEPVALIERPGGLALKCVAIERVPASAPKLVDEETPTQLTRRIETAPDPEVWLDRLREALAGTALPYDVRAFLVGRRSLDAWAARRTLGCPDSDDDEYRDALVSARVEAQSPDGSWGGDVVRTARVLRDLADLDLGRDHPAVDRGAAWLVARPQSDYNPGQWFATDALVAEQAQVIASREAGEGGRFRSLKVSQKRRVMAGDSLIRNPCGPLIMWPNALVLDALLRLGYGGHPRVETALRTMRSNDWCECGYQHGTHGWRRVDPMNDEELAAFETRCIRAYHCAGLASEDDLRKMDLSHRGSYLRVERLSSNDGGRFRLAGPDHIQGCEFVTTRSMAVVDDPRMRRFAEAHLWRFASRQRPDGTFPPERYGTGFGWIGTLGLFARFDHPVAKLVILRAVPRLVDTQQPDGSWQQPVKVGRQTYAREDAATRTVIGCLRRVGAWLPSFFWSSGGEWHPVPAAER
jgi:hypothetical protein